MLKNKGFSKNIFSITAAIKESSGIVRNINTKVFSAMVAIVMLIASFSVISKYYTIGYDVYYGDVNVGTTGSKAEALEHYSQAETDVLSHSGEALGYELSFVMTIAPISRIIESDIYRGIVEAAEGVECCFSINVNGEMITMLKTREEAREAIRLYVASFEREGAVVSSEYTIEQEKDIVTGIRSVEEAVEEIKASGKMIVSYLDVVAEDIEISYDETYIEDSSIPQGLVYCYQEGETGSGVKAISYYENGSEKHVSGPEIQVVKEPVEKIVYVGTGETAGLVKNMLPWPAEGKFSSEYGRRWGRKHTGIDIAAPKGTPIYAPAAGIVTFAGDKSGWGYGNYIVIDHGAGYETTYAHMNSISVSEGDVVKEGDQIGTVGTTGRVTGSNLHFEILLNGSYVNPMDYIAG